MFWFVVLVSSHVDKLCYYWSQLLNVLLYISVYRVIVADCVSRVQDIASIVDPFDYSLVVTVDLYSSFGLSCEGVEPHVLPEESQYRCYSICFGLPRVGFVLAAWYIPLATP